MMEGGQVDGKQYFIPADWGFSSPLYRSDKVDTNEDTWALFYDEKYKGKISWWDSLENFLVAGYVNGVDDPWNMDDGELEDMKKFLISKKHVVRNFWASQTDLDADLKAGNIWIAYAWAGSYVAAKDAGHEVTYMEPKEGRLSWVCGFVLIKDSPNYHHAHAYVDEWSSKFSAEWIEANYAYGHANTDGRPEQARPGVRRGAPFEGSLGPAGAQGAHGSLYRAPQGIQRSLGRGQSGLGRRLDRSVAVDAQPVPRTRAASGAHGSAART